MKKIQWQILLGIALAVLSAILYTIHFFVFRDSHHIFIYLLGDIAFLPIEVLIVTLIIDRVLSVREKKAMLEKLNMVIGTFFSEAGLGLIHLFADFDLNARNIKRELAGVEKWTEKDFTRVSLMLTKFKYSVNSHAGDINQLKSFLARRREFLLRLLENPNLLEHEKFTELLRAVFHLTEELDYRKDFSASPESDYIHLSADIKRAYLLIISEWITYIKYLKKHYPYLYSLAARVNPFDESATPVVV